MNTPEERDMRRRLLLDERSRNALGVFARVEWARKLLRKVLLKLTDINGSPDHDLAVFRSLDDLAPFCTTEEMSTLLDQRQQLHDEATPEYFYCVSYSIRGNFAIYQLLTRVHKLPASPTGS